MAREIYIDRQCMESKVDWMQSELNKIVRVMDCKLVSHLWAPCACCPVTQALTNVSLIPSWWEQA